VKNLTDVIIETEWDMFDKVNNVSGRADCQDDRETFDIMRRSQFDAWNEDLLLSYLGDLDEALAQDRNILTEKYAYMMEYTAPLEFRDIEDMLPPVSDEKRALVRRITDMCLADYDEVVGAYPLVASRGRPQYRVSEEGGYPSAETYMLGEFSTYSMRTLNKYLEYLLNLRDSGVNMSRVILENSMKRYGFASLDDTEARLRTGA
jgi:hypothetical protein